MGDHAAAIPLYRQALEIYRTALGENHPDYATSLNNLAGLYCDIRDHANQLLELRPRCALIPCSRHGTARRAIGVADPDFDLETVAMLEVAQPNAGLWVRLLGRGKETTTTPRNRPIHFQSAIARPGDLRDLDHWGAFICQGNPSPLGTLQQGTADADVVADRSLG